VILPQPQGRRGSPSEADGTAQFSAREVRVKSALPTMGETLLKGVAGGISGLTSLAFFLSFTLFCTFFLLKDGRRSDGS
jgi:predicted PurR-regulated permease PerM